MSSWRNNKRRNSITFTAIITVVVFAVLLYAIKNPLEFHKITSGKGAFDTSQDFVKFLDVGQGDSALIYSNGYSAVIDVGLPNAANDIGLDLADCNISQIDAVLISHLHSDHTGALPRIAENFKIDNLIMPEFLKNSIIAAQNGKSIATNNGAAFHNAKQGMSFNIGEFELTLLGAFSDSKNENNRSVFVMAEINGIKFFFTGDAEAKAEKQLLGENLNLDCDVLKVSHHGSNTASSIEFLKASTPEYAVISVGQDNMYRHPHSETLSALKSVGAKVYRTDHSGDITFNIEKDSIEITEEK